MDKAPRSRAGARRPAGAPPRGPSGYAAPAVPPHGSELLAAEGCAAPRRALGRAAAAPSDAGTSGHGRTHVSDAPDALAHAARAVLEDLRRCQIELGGAYERALIAAAERGDPPAAPLLIAAIEAGRQAVDYRQAGPDARTLGADAAVEIRTDRRFIAAGREFEPHQRYRLTPAEYVAVQWRASLEPAETLYQILR